MKDAKKIMTCIVDVAYKLSVIVTGIAMAIFAHQQVLMNKIVHEDSKALHQPIFKVVFDDWKSPNSDIDDHKDITIQNVGEEAKSIDNITLNTYIKFDYASKPNGAMYTYYIPIIGYFNWFILTGNLVGRVAFSYNPQQNKLYSQNLHAAILDYNQDKHNFAMFELMHLTKIQYVDKYNQSHVAYFINAGCATEEDYESIKRESDKLNIIDPIEISTITLQKLISLCAHE